MKTEGVAFLQEKLGKPLNSTSEYLPRDHKKYGRGHKKPAAEPARVY